jgi:predicted nucleic acid-binding protein
VKAADTSVVVAALAGWHEGHAAASAAVAAGVRLPAHCLLESYSVLTRLPPPHRLAPRVARDLLRSTFGEPPLTLGAAAHAGLLDQLVEARVEGGGAYDALIGVTAARHDAILLTRDHRAVRVYAALDVRFELVA